ncbi:hypothetical protein DM02DRAFT_701848 [Periconia macrospinosa]|uniref:Uncharacterized protein n=1 Tax=Periconia macrospinosa TaxID=97972 RepID=A0A2V1D1V0_9PLEO|nr:hypothetical protein DM02DRAFT_701848 [Periconia macrospinosa]
MTPTASAPIIDAAISPAWQDAIEQQTFCSLKINIDEINTFKRYISPPNASRARRLTWLVVDLAPRSSTSNARIDTNAISKGISTLFTALADSTSQGNNSAPLKLQFSMNYYDDYEAFDIIIPDSVPSLPQVDMFIYDAVHKLSALKVTCVQEIMKRLPRMSKASFKFLDEIKWGARRRRLERQRLPLSVENIWLNVLPDHTRDEDKQPAYLLSGRTLQNDPFTRALCHLATFPNLRVLQLIGPVNICSTLFSDLPSFPALTDFQLEFSTESADGKWFFVGNEKLIKRLKQAENGGYESNHEVGEDDEMEEVNEMEDTKDVEENNDNEENNGVEQSNDVKEIVENEQTYYDNKEVEEAEKEHDDNKEDDDEEDDDEEDDDEDEDNEDDEEEFNTDSNDSSYSIVYPVNPSDPDGPIRQRSTKSNYYRTAPDPNLIPALLISAAKFVQSTATLRRFILRHKNTAGEPGSYRLWKHYGMSRLLEVWVLKKGMPRCDWDIIKVPADDEIRNGGDRVYWRMREDWRPSEEVMEAWGEAAPGARVFFLKEEFWKLGGYSVYRGDLEDEEVR